MKNLYLAMTFFVLLGIAYYIEEIYKAEQSEEKTAVKRQKTSLLKNIPLNFTGVETPQYRLELNNKNWEVKSLDYPASEQLIGLLRKILLGIEVVGVLQDKDSNHVFSNTNIPFAIEVGANVYKYRLGDFSKVTGRFYIEEIKDDQKVVYLCQDTSFLDTTYKSEEELAIKKYLRLKNILGGQKDLFIDRNLFKLIDIKKLQSLSIDNKRNRNFLINLADNKTSPPIISGLSYLNFNRVLNHYFGVLQVKNLRQENKRILSNLVSTLTLYHDNKKSIAKYYKALNDQYGHFVKIDGFDFIFEFDEQGAAIFNLNVQDFWNKKILPENFIGEKKKLKFSMGLVGDKKYDFVIDDLAKFKVNFLSSEILHLDQNMVNFIFNLVFNLTDFRQANYVDTFSHMDPKENCLELEMRQTKLALCLNDREIHVYNLKNKILFVFQYSTKELGITDWKQLFTLKGK